MKGNLTLPDNHRRSLSVTAQVIEDTLDEMETLLRSRGKGKLTTTIEATYSDADRMRLLATISQMRQANTEMVKAFNLRATHFSEENVIAAKTTHMWTVLVDSRPRGLKGFGELSPELARVVDSHVNKLLTILQELQ